MSYTYWPAILPQRPLAGKFQFAPQSNKAVFQPEVGPSIDRRRATSTVKAYQAGFDLTSFEQVREFERWFAQDLHDGVDPFLWFCPVDELLCLWKFGGGGSEPYQIDPQRGTYSLLNFKIQKLAVWG